MPSVLFAEKCEVTEQHYAAKNMFLLRINIFVVESIILSYSHIFVCVKANKPQKSVLRAFLLPEREILKYKAVLDLIKCVPS